MLQSSGSAASKQKRRSLSFSLHPFARDGARKGATRSRRSAEGRDLDGEAKRRAQALDRERKARAAYLTVRQAITAYLADLANRDSAQTGRPLAPASIEAARYRLSQLEARHGDDVSH